VTTMDGIGTADLLERALIGSVKNGAGVSRKAEGKWPSECKLCGKGKLEFGFTLPAFDGPYANDTGETLRSFFKCEKCGFLCVEPFDEEVYGTYYSKLNGGYHCLHNLDTTRNRTIADMLRRTEIHRVLDFGCGTGEFLSLLPPRVVKCGIELSDAAKQVARERGIKILQEKDLDDDAFSHSFDVVTAIDVVEHIKDLPEWRRKIAAVLKPGGYFIFMTGNLDSWAARTLGRYWYYLHFAEHVSFLSETATRMWLESEFDAVQIELVTHHEFGRVDLVKSVVKFCVAWTLQKFGMASRFRISSSFPATSDHMLVRARRRSS
jgi:2-polyprenyl-3-methyl-5-hydroxy-6-metoxy-1,4-benzoquinol methylase